MKPLHCDHVEGRVQLVDELATGTLAADGQKILAHLLRDEDVAEDFDEYNDVSDYEWQRVDSGTIHETWTCPVCGVYHNDFRDNAA